jgi:transcriptional regulator with XRE-family HTH domain
MDAAAEDALDIVRVRSWLRTGRAREIRKRAGLSQADVGKAVGTNASQMSRWEAGKGAPHRDSALKLARLYEELERLAAIEDAGDAAAGQQERIA